MDDARFDRLARTLTARGPRRAVLSLFAASLATPAAGKNKKKRPCGGRCMGGTLCCADACVSVLTDPFNCGACGNACREVDACVNAACQACPVGQIRCAERCVDTASDPANCGACNRLCGKYEVCQQGQCRCLGETCANGFSCCPAGYRCISANGGCCQEGSYSCMDGTNTCCPTGQRCGGDGLCYTRSSPRRTARSSRGSPQRPA